MNITLIGGSGFVGTRLLDLISPTQGLRLRNIDLLPSHFFNDLTTIGDVRKQEQMDTELKGADVVVLLAAQHRDDVSPVSLYYDTNVGGMKVTLRAMERNGCRRLIFFSSVAVYGLNKENPTEDHEKDPFNHYGKSKWQAEQVAEEWYRTHPDWEIVIIRPTVIFGERNRGNVYNLLRQISSGHFLMVGSGENCKSMAYVGNIVAFVEFFLKEFAQEVQSEASKPQRGSYRVFNYVDKPDMNMNDLVSHVSNVLGRHIPATHFPKWLGMMGGYCFDAVAKLTGKKLTVSSVRVKKFCATTQFSADKMQSTGFRPPFTLAEGLARTLSFEFLHPAPDAITYVSE